MPLIQSHDPKIPTVNSSSSCFCLSASPAICIDSERASASAMSEGSSKPFLELPLRVCFLRVVTFDAFVTALLVDGAALWGSVLSFSLKYGDIFSEFSVLLAADLAKEFDNSADDSIEPKLHQARLLAILTTNEIS